MTLRALAALALGGSLFIFLSGSLQPVIAQQFTTAAPELIDRYRLTLSTDQGNLTLHYLLGVALLRNNQNAAALKELQVAYPAYQESIEAHYNLAIASLRLEDLPSTEIYLEQAVALGADDISGIFPVADLYFNMALKSQEMGDSNEAIRYFHKVLTLDPERYEVYRQLGDLYAHRGDTALALKSFHTYLEQFPDDPFSRDYLFALEFNHAQDLLAGNDLSGAENSFSTALELQPDSSTALYYLGYIAYAQHRPEQAVVLLNKAFLIADEPVRQTIRPLLYNSALALRKNGRLVSALNAASLLADHERALFNEVFLAGTLSLELGKHRAAYEYLQRAVTLEPNNQRAHQNLLAAELGAFNELLSVAKIHIRSVELAEAEAVLQYADELQPQSPRVASLRRQLDQTRTTKAAVYFFNAQTALEAGDFTTAFDQVNAGLAVQPDNINGIALRDEVNAALTVDLDKALAEAETATQAGNWDQAAEIYSWILTIAPLHPEALESREKMIKARQQQVLSLLVEGQKSLDAGQADQAINAFSQLLALEPEHEQALKGLDTANQMRANRLDEFLQKGRQAMGRSHFQEAREWFNKAQTVDSSSRAAQELAELEKRIRQKADRLAEQAEQAGRVGKYKQAGQLFTQALSLVTEHKPSIAGRRELATHIDEAIRTRLQQATKALQQTDYATATQAYRTVLDIAPGNREALEGLKESREKQSDNLSRLVKQGQQALDAGDLAAAESLLAEALRQDAFHEDAQQLRQRLEQVRQAGAQPGDEQKLYLQGIAYYTQGDYPEAIKSWETVLLLDPDHIKSIQNIAKTRRKLHRIEEYSGN
jgi:tetratricopeptide (TPR) repeat protein